MLGYKNAKDVRLLCSTSLSIRYRQTPFWENLKNTSPHVRCGYDDDAFLRPDQKRCRKWASFTVCSLKYVKLAISILGTTGKLPLALVKGCMPDLCRSMAFTPCYPITECKFTNYLWRTPTSTAFFDDIRICFTTWLPDNAYPTASCILDPEQFLPYRYAWGIKQVI